MAALSEWSRTAGAAVGDRYDLLDDPGTGGGGGGTVCRAGDCVPDRFAAVKLPDRAAPGTD